MDEYLQKCFDYVTEDLQGEIMEDGDEYVFSLNNCAVFIAMKDREIITRVIGGKPIEIDVDCPFFE